MARFVILHYIFDKYFALSPILFRYSLFSIFCVAKHPLESSSQLENMSYVRTLGVFRNEKKKKNNGRIRELVLSIFWFMSLTFNNYFHAPHENYSYTQTLICTFRSGQNLLLIDFFNFTIDRQAHKNNKKAIKKMFNNGPKHIFLTFNRVNKISSSIAEERLHLQN